MFQQLSEKFLSVFERLKSHGALTPEQILVAIRDVRVALLEADVALPVVKNLIQTISKEAIGKKVLDSITPGQQIVKIIHDHLVELLGSEPCNLSLNYASPMVIYMVGLQGAGKTTTTAKLALYLKKRHKKKILLTSTDIYRPAAQKQLAQLARQIDVPCLYDPQCQKPLDIVLQAYSHAKNSDCLLIDTAGRLHINQPLMDELTALIAAVPAHETLLVADAMTGQDAACSAQHFAQHLKLTGIVLTRMDGDHKGGAALSMTALTKKPIKFAGVGEKLNQLEPFDPERMAQRILGMGDVLSLVEQAQELYDVQEEKKIQEEFNANRLTFNVLESQFVAVGKMGGLDKLLARLPASMGPQKTQGFTETDIQRNLAIIRSMTYQEKGQPQLLNRKRKCRIAAGSGTDVPSINRLVKMLYAMENTWKHLKTNKKKLGAFFKG